ncbi:MAG: S-methyl-5-thioribose-1-phosphate isomerase [Candidatus Diapherotrites archaeon]|nr:S-methyl-5-thioribose-1-phosphate isomerase [Candidatus Diapherotrites archaeon]
MREGDRIIKKVITDIKTLKIQGATSVRRASIEALLKAVKKEKFKNREEFRKKVIGWAKQLAYARATEPETRNAIAEAISVLNYERELDELKEIFLNACKRINERLDNAKERIAIIGANLIKKAEIVMTHCHSTTVQKALYIAHKRGSLKTVITTETRPLYQGRITAKKLAKMGIKVIHIVDSAASSYMAKADYFLTGCDAILANGSIVNKIGTRMMSILAKKENVPHLVLASSYKFDAATLFGEEIIEIRNASEVWETNIKNIKIENPAFDITESELIKAIVCELGAFSPESFAVLAYKEFAPKLKNLERLRRRN